VVEAAKRMPNIDLSNCELNSADGDGEAIAKLLRSFPALKSLDLSANDKLGARAAHDIAGGLAASRSITSITFADCNLTAGDTSRDTSGSVALINAIKQHPTLKSANFSDCNLKEDAGEALGRVLAENRTLAELNLKGGNSIRINEDSLFDWAKAQNMRETGKKAPDGMTAMLEGLKVNKSLKSLELSGYNVAAVALAEALKVHPALQSLDLSGCCLEGEEWKTVAAGLAQNRVLTWLDLRNTPMDVEGAKAIVDAVKDKRQLKTILGLTKQTRLTTQTVTPAIALLLAFELKKNSVLEELNLEHGNIVGLNYGLHANKKAYNAEGITAFGEMLRGNSTLTSIKLNKNNLTDADKKLINDANAQRKNPLVKLEL